MTPTHVWFCVSDLDVYDAKIFPFAFIAQFVTAKQVVVMTHANFNTLAEELGPKLDIDLTIIHNTSRCGSTLLCQMFSQIPNTRVMSEPWSFMHAHRTYNLKEIGKLEYHRLLRSMVKIHCKPSQGINSIVIKLSLLDSPQVPLIKSIFPKTKLLFIMRHVEPSFESFMRVISQLPDPLPSEKNDFWFFYLPFTYDNKEYEAVREKYTKVRRTLSDIYALSLAYGGALMVYLQNKHRYDHAMLYEDLMKDAIKECQILLTKLDIPDEYTDDALKGMDSDSQKNMFAKTPGITYLTDQDWDISDRLQRVLDTPVRKNMTVDELRNVVK